MTTKDSPIDQLRAQARRIATALKAAERGEVIAKDPAGRLVDARGREKLTFALAMDDKTLKIEMPWATIRSHSKAELVEWIVAQMREERPTG